MKTETLGDIQKTYESMEAARTLMPGLPVMIRLDGRAFHTFTKGLTRPFHGGLSQAMINTTKRLCEELNACIGYTQSDEITLILDDEKPILFNGKIQKLTSVVTSMATLFFNEEKKALVSEKADTPAFFDCRVWNVPSRTAAAANLVWRENDATKNSITMAALSVFSHKEIDGKNSAEKIDMLFSKGIKWEAYPAFFKRGTYIQRIEVATEFTPEEIERLPLKHNARKDRTLKVMRHVYQQIAMPIFTKVENREMVIFRGETARVTIRYAPSVPTH